MKSSTQDKIEGTAKTVSGKLTELTGQALGKPRLQVKGKMKQAEGRTQKKVGEIEQVLGH